MKVKNLKVVAPVLVTVMLTGCSLTNTSIKTHYNYKYLSLDIDKQHLSAEVNINKYCYIEKDPIVMVLPDGSEAYFADQNSVLTQKNGKPIAIETHYAYKPLIKTPHLK